LSGLHLITRMTPDPPPAREGVRRRHVPLKEGRSALAAGVSDLPLEGSGNSVCLPDLLVRAPALHSGGSGIATCRWSMQDPDLQGPRGTIMPRLEDCTPYSDDHAARWGWQDAGAISARPRTTATPDAMPHSVLPIVFNHCTPRFGGKRRL